MEEDYNVEELEKCIEHCMTHCRHFPNYPEIIAIIGNYSTKGEALDEEEIKLTEHKAKMLHQDSEHNKKMFLSKYSQEQLDEWLALWYKEVFPKSDPSKFGFSLNVFLPIFFQDLVDGKDGINGAIKQGKLKHAKGKRD